MRKMFFCLMAMMGVMTVSAQQKLENKDAQAAINNIMTRTSIRQYTDEPVSKSMAMKFLSIIFVNNVESCF